MIQPGHLKALRLPTGRMLALLALVAAVFLVAPTSAASEIVYTKTAPTESGCENPWCYEIWSAEGTGGEGQVVIPGPRPGPEVQGGAALSSDGGLIAVQAFDRDELQDFIYVFSADGTLRETYGNLGGQYAGDPRFSPDEQTLIYAADAPGGTGLYSLERGVGNPNLILNWAHYQNSPTFSPDEQSIAFASPTDPEGEFHSKWKEQFPYQIYIANPDGTEPVRVTPASFEFATSPKFSRDGQRIVFRGFKSKGSDQGIGLFTIKTDGSDLQRLTSGDDRSPDWSPDGSTILFKRKLDGLFEINVDGTGLTEVVSNENSDAPSYRQPRTVVDYEAILEANVPEVRYEAQESFYADSAAMIADNPGNYLRQEDGSVIAASSDPAYDLLSLSFLGSPLYANEVAALSSDFVDEDDEDYAGDAQFMRSDPEYADRVYGRVAQAPDESLWLQYWLFYYYNDQEVLGVGVHEGDWEMVQYRLDFNGAPDLAAYAQHSGGESCEWGDVERSWVEDGPVGRYAPVVYSARSSHASYFHAGTYRDGLDPAPDDHATGDGVVTAPSLVPIEATDSWIAWPGRWGASGSSPDGPLHNAGGGKWSDPSTWAGELSECGSVNFSSSAVSVESPVPAPEVNVERRGNRAVFEYSFPSWPRNPEHRPHFIVLTIDSAGRGHGGVQLSPLSYSHRVTGEHGRVVQPFGLGAGSSFKALASAFSKSGVRSPVVAVAGRR